MTYITFLLTNGTLLMAKRRYVVLVGDSYVSLAEVCSVNICCSSASCFRRYSSSIVFIYAKLAPNAVRPITIAILAKIRQAQHVQAYLKVEPIILQNLFSSGFPWQMLSISAVPPSQSKFKHACWPIELNARVFEVSSMISQEASVIDATEIGTPTMEIEMRVIKYKIASIAMIMTTMMMI